VGKGVQSWVAYQRTQLLNGRTGESPSYLVPGEIPILDTSSRMSHQPAPMNSTWQTARFLWGVKPALSPPLNEVQSWTHKRRNKGTGNVSRYRNRKALKWQNHKTLVSYTWTHTFDHSWTNSSHNAPHLGWKIKTVTLYISPVGPTPPVQCKQKGREDPTKRHGGSTVPVRSSQIIWGGPSVSCYLVTPPYWAKAQPDSLHAYVVVSSRLPQPFECLSLFRG
jgi:hypothetical protein